MTRPLPHRFPFPAQFPETQPHILAREDDKRQLARRCVRKRVLLAVAIVAFLLGIVA